MSACTLNRPQFGLDWTSTKHCSKVHLSPCNNFVLQVCSNHNETFASDCDLHRKRCLCEESGDDVMDAGVGSACGEANMYKHIHIEYYGASPLSKIMNDNNIYNTIKQNKVC